MTASTTPRLGLMRPANSDTFVVNDFDSTFDILDQTPGIKQVANYASLPSSLTTAQHGSVYLQLDNKSMWMWNKPGSAAGAWMKLNTVGMIQTMSQGSVVSTASTNVNAGATMISTSFTFPGGRFCMIYFYHYSIGNSGSYGYSVVNLLVNGAVVQSSVGSGGAPNKGISHRILHPISGLAAGSTVTVKVSITASSYGGGTTSAGAAGQLSIWEI